MTATPTRWRIVALICLALTSALLVGGVVFYAVRAAFWPSDEALRASTVDRPWPSLRITAQYNGANAQTIEETITLPLETQLAGLEGVETVESVSREGSATITLFCRPGTDLDTIRVMACNRVALAEPMLPDEVKMRGISVTKSRLLPALWLILDSPDQSRDEIFLRNLAQTVLLPEVTTIPGVSGATAGAGNGPNVGLFLDADRLAAHGLGLADVTRALAERVQGPGKAKPVEELLNVSVRAGANGQEVFLRDVATLEVCSSGPSELVHWSSGVAAAIAVECEGDAGALFQTVQDKLPDLVGRLSKGTNLHLLPGPAIGGAEALLMDARLPDAASDERVRHVATSVAEALEGLTDPKAAKLVPAVLALPTDEPAAFRLYVALSPRNERAWSYEEISMRSRGLFAAYPDVIFRIDLPLVLEMPPLLRAPVVVGLSGPEDAALPVANAVRDRLVTSGVVSDLQAEYSRPVPQLWVVHDVEKSRRLAVSRDDVMNSLQAYLGAARVPDGLGHELPVGLRRQGQKDEFGRTWIIRTPADAAKREEDLKRIMVPDIQGKMVPLGDVVTVRNTLGIPYLRRIDGKRCMLLTANPAEGISQRQADARAREIATEVIEQMGLTKAYTVLQK